MSNKEIEHRKDFEIFLTETVKLWLKEMCEKLAAHSFLMFFGAVKS